MHSRRSSRTSRYRTTCAASVLVAKGDRAGARRSFERALALDGADFTATSSLAKLDLADGKVIEAQKRFDALLAKDPKNARALLAIAELRARSGASSEEVVALIAKAIAAEPTNAEPRLALISYYITAKEPKKAVAAAQDALAAMPDRADVLYAAGQAQQAAGETNQAAKTYGKLAQIRPGSPLPLVREAETQLAARDYDAAVATFKRALALKPDLLEAQRGLILAYLASRRTNDALAVARDVQRQRPKEPFGFVYEGDIYVSQKAWKEAAAAFRKGLAAAGTTDLAARTHSALRSAGNDAEAQQLAANWLKSHPKDRDFRAYLAESALAKRRHRGGNDAVQGDTRPKSQRCAGAQQPGLALGPEQGSQGDRVRGEGQQARPRQSRVSRYVGRRSGGPG